MLWSCGGGALPVLDATGTVIGILTDRDVCVAVGTKDKRPSELAAEQVMTRQVATCRTGDDIHTALQTMRTRRVRRLPVVDGSGKLQGMLSLSDLIMDARRGDGSRPDLSYEDVMGTLKGIYWPREHPLCESRPTEHAGR
jgi:CBS-domain-containing membrane protein